jgi:hypothetical protein
MGLGAATGADQGQDQRGERAAPRDSGSPENHLGGNLAEGEGDNFSRNAIFTYGELGAGLRLAADDGQPDRPEGGGDDRAA